MIFSLAAALLLYSAPTRAEQVRVATVAVEDPGHAGLSRWFEALRGTASGKVARAIHYGDSTIASDGIARTVRARLATRFGDAGPGFVTAAFDPRWNARSDVDAQRSGDWAWRTILFGGAGGRYGLGGVVGILQPGAGVRARAIDAAGAPVPQRHVEVWYQAGVGYGALRVKADGRELAREAASAGATEDRRIVLDVPEGATELRVTAESGPVPLYGLVLERGTPGATWEALGVTGVGSKSFTTFAGERLADQVALRAPDLVVVMIGGNEAGYPILTANKGAGYAPIFSAALATIRAGAPNASCLVVTPLDQGYLDDAGVPQARPGMPNLVAVQRREALAAGCAFWSAWDAMGGSGAALRWANARGLGAGDYVHLTPKALELIGDALATSLLASYDAWAGA